MLRLGQPSRCSCRPEPQHQPLLTLAPAGPEAATAGEGGGDATLLAHMLCKLAGIPPLHTKGLVCRLFVICSSKQLATNQSLVVCLDYAHQI